MTVKSTLRRALPPSIYVGGQRIMQSARRLRYTWGVNRRLSKAGLWSDVLAGLRPVLGLQAPAYLGSLTPAEIEIVGEARRSSAQALTPGPGPSVTVVLLSFDRWHLTRRCLESLYAHSDYPFEALIFDNGSQPETIAQLGLWEAAHDNLRVIYNPRNLGVAAGRNRAAAEVTSEYLVHLDNDMVCHAGWLRELMACARRHDAAFASPFILHPDGLLWAAGGDLIRTYDDTYVEIAHRFYNADLDLTQRLLDGGDFRASFIFGAAGLYRRDAFHACGGFADYRVGWEDVDFALRLGRQGYAIWVTPRSLVTHDHQWRPANDADRDYIRARYDLDTLETAAAQFEATWGIKVMRQQVRQDTQRMVAEKLAA